MKAMVWQVPGLCSSTSIPPRGSARSAPRCPAVTPWRSSAAGRVIAVDDIPARLNGAGSGGVACVAIITA